MHDDFKLLSAELVFFLIYIFIEDPVLVSFVALFVML